jgi:hypothetical protein
MSVVESGSSEVISCSCSYTAVIYVYSAQQWHLMVQTVRYVDS